MTYDVEALIRHHSADCYKLVNGKCMTRSCLVRGGYVGPGPVDYSVASCEALETVEALRAGHPAVTVSAEEKPDRLETALDDFQRTMAWRPESTGLEKTLVLGNLRGFAGFLRERGFVSWDAALHNGAALTPWRLIDSAPKSPVRDGRPQGIYLLGYCWDEAVHPSAHICIIWWEPLKDGGGWWSDGGDNPVKPTHWMPLPEAPGFTEEACPGHVASESDPRVCGRCGAHIDSLRS